MSHKNQSSRTQAVRPSSEDARKKSRRSFLARSAGIAGASVTALTARTAQAAQEIAPAPPWMQTMGAPMRGYGQPAKYEDKVVRALTPGYPTIAPGVGTSRTPL